MGRLGSVPAEFDQLVIFPLHVQVALQLLNLSRPLAVFFSLSFLLHSQSCQYSSNSRQLTHWSATGQEFRHRLPGFDKALDDTIRQERKIHLKSLSTIFLRLQNQFMDSTIDQSHGLWAFYLWLRCEICAFNVKVRWAPVDLPELSLCLLRNLLCLRPLRLRRRKLP